MKRLRSKHVAIPITDSAIPRLSQEGEMDGIRYTLEKISWNGFRDSRTRDPRERLLQTCESMVVSTGAQWTADLQKDVPNKWEKHGDLVLLPDGCFQSDTWRNLDDIWRRVAECLGGRRLAVKSRVSSNGFRTPQVSLLLGNDGWVQHKDNGISYSYDVTKCMFSAGNISEKIRVGNFDCEGQIIVDLYAGIGYFTLPYLVHAKAAHVHACEWNPDAIRALRRTLRVNGVRDRCTVHEGDNRRVCPRGIADRVNLGLIPTSENSWPVAVKALKDRGGVLHIHGNVEGPRVVDPACSKDTGPITDIEHGSVTLKQSLEVRCSSSSAAKKNPKACWLLWARKVSNEIQRLLTETKNGQWSVEILHIEKVKSYAPRIDHLVLDLSCTHSNDMPKAL